VSINGDPNIIIELTIEGESYTGKPAFETTSIKQ
jgi:hypothetical protein